MIILEDKFKYKFIESSGMRTPGRNIQTSSVSRLLQCKKCGVTCTTQHALLRHITSKHENSSNVAAYCGICHRFFKTKWSRATHNSRYHRN